MNGFLKLIGVVLAVVLCASVANATIIVQNEWKLGDADPGAVLGGTGTNPTVDSGPGKGGVPMPLTRVGSPTYVAGAHAYSTLAANFANPSDTATNYYWNGQTPVNPTSTNTLFPTTATGIGVDFWFKLTQVPQLARKFIFSKIIILRN